MDDVTKQAISDVLSNLTDARADLDSVARELDKIGTALAGLLIDGQEPPGPIPAMTVTYRLGALPGQVVALWQPVTGADAYAVGRDGEDRGGYGAWATTTNQLSWVFENLNPTTTYTLSVGAYRGLELLSEGSATLTTPADPVVTTPPSTGLPLAGRSKTGTNVILFRSGVDDLNGLTKWETDNGVKVDGLMRFVDRDHGEDAFLAESFWNQMGQIANAGRTTVIALPWAPVGAGPGMNAAVVKGDWDAFHAKIGALALKFNLNRENVVFRLSWEYNGTWYPWSTNNGGAGFYRAAWSRTVDNLRRAGLTRIKFDQCANKGPQASNQTTGADVFVPGKVDICGVDHYAMWPKQTDADGFSAALNQVPGIISQRAVARANKVQWSIDENGPINPAGKDFGGDNPVYAQSMIATAKAGAKDGTMALFTIYDDAGNPNTFHHELSSNPVWRGAVLGWLKDAQK